MPDFNVVPVFKTLLVEGQSRRETFRGLVLAMGWWETEPGGGAAGGWGGGGTATPELHYLVSDQAKPAPIWVEARQLTSQRWFPVVTPSGEAPESGS
jgi:hypothetical protein